jgi:hypothetical protein
VVNSGAAVEIIETTARDLPALLRMMRSLAEQPPAIPFDEGEVRAAFEHFLPMQNWVKPGCFGWAKSLPGM